MRVTIVNCFDTYEQRVDMVLAYFLDKNDDVKVYSSDFRHFRKIRREEKKEHYYFFEAKPYYKNLSPQRLNSHRKLAKDIFARLDREQNDLLWILLPPNSFVKEAKIFKRKHPETKIIFDIMDMWPETMPVGKLKTVFPFTFWKNLRDKNIGCADFVVTECDLFQKKLGKYVPVEKLKTIYLAREVKRWKSYPNLSEDNISLCYLGSINNIIDIDVIGYVIESVKAKKNVILHIIGDGEKREELIEKAKQAGAEVIYHGKIYDVDEKQKIFDQCHFGLNIMKDSVYVGLTMKSIDYLQGGLPIINNIKGDTWDFIIERKFGYNLDEIGKLDLNNYNKYRVNSRAFFETELSKERFDKNLDEVLEKIN